MFIGYTYETTLNFFLFCKTQIWKCDYFGNVIIDVIIKFDYSSLAV